MELPQNYNPKEAEPRLQKFWQENNIFQFHEQPEKPIYSIDTPPPTISGKMHLGHAFSFSQQDFIARYKRMKGFNVFYPFGTDDNGLPTEKLVVLSNGVDTNLYHASEEKRNFMRNKRSKKMKCN